MRQGSCWIQGHQSLLLILPKSLCPQMEPSSGPCCRQGILLGSVIFFYNTGVPKEMMFLIT